MVEARPDPTYFHKFTDSIDGKPWRTVRRHTRIEASPFEYLYWYFRLAQT